jgi:RND family efflux transporter MFP subunit
MKRNSLLLLALIIVTGTVFFVSSTRLKEPVAPFSEVSTVGVKAERVTPAKIDRVLQFRGVLDAGKESEVVARAAGLVKEIQVDVGDRVSQGALLAIIEPTELLRRITLTEVALASARAHFKKKQQELAEAEKERERTRELVKADLIPRSELGAAENKAETVRAEAEQARAQAAQEEAILVQSRALLSLSRVTAGFSGVVIRRLVEPGSRVVVGTPVVTLGVVDTMKVAIRMTAADLELVQDGMTAQIQIGGPDGAVLEGKLNTSKAETESTEQYSPVEIHIPNPKGTLKPGTNVNVFLSPSP